MNIKCILPLLPFLALSAQAKDKRYNIIYIMCDDMGYGDLGCYGQQLIKTPHLDRMASEGMRFTQAYAGCPVSAPSRACFMTGQHTGHTHVRGNKEYWPQTFGKAKFGDNDDYSVIGQEPYLLTHPILPELFKQKGYNTGMFGKWAGGFFNLDFPDSYALDQNGNTDTKQWLTTSSSSLPQLRGVDVFYGPICQFQAHTYYPNFLNRYDPARGDRHLMVDTLQQNIQHQGVYSANVDYEQRKQYSAQLIHDYALDWLDRQTEDTPFLGIFTYTLPHAELWQPNDEILQYYHDKFPASSENAYPMMKGNWYWGGNDKHAQFAAMITRLDKYVGEILQKLEDKGLADKTLVIFTSDNGPHEEGGADPDFFNRDGLLKGKKRSTYEGGIRIPFICKGPNVPKGSVNQHQLAFYDLMPTLMEYSRAFSTHEIAEHSMHTSQEQSAIDPHHDYYDGISFYRTLTGHKRQPQHQFLYWEFHETDMLGLRMGDWKLVVDHGKCHLYDLATDVHEDNDLAPQHPEIVETMKGIISHQHVESTIPQFKVTIPR